MSFQQSLENGTKAEIVFYNYYQDKVNTIRRIGSTLNNKKNLASLQRVAGDLRVTTKEDKIVRFEVKADSSAHRTGNLFLETLSDNGSRTGRQTIGWFDNAMAQYDYFVWHFVKSNQLFMVKRQELKDYISRIRTSLRTVPMVYDQAQWNRSEGLLVKYQMVLDNCPSAKLVDL